LVSESLKLYWGTRIEFAYPVPLFTIFKYHETILINSNNDVI
jgi:hypothetical protein